MTTIAEIKKDDYVVAVDGGRSILVRVLSNRDGTIKGKWEHHDQESDVEVEVADVKANLGPDPQIGSVYGCKTERLLDVTDTKPITAVEWYFNANAEVKQQVHDGILAGARLLKKHHIHPILKVVKAKVLFNTARKLGGRTMLGSYQCKGGIEENPDILTIKYHPEVVKLFPYLICHEAGHGIWSRLMSADMRARWIVEFWQRAEVTEISAEEMVDAIKLAVRERAILLTDPDMQPALDAALANVLSTTGLRPRDVLVLLQHNISAAKAVLGPWRDYPSYSGERSTLVTDYADTNVEEFWCESLANFCTGKSIPDYLKDLFQETLEHVQNRNVWISEE